MYINLCNNNNKDIFNIKQTKPLRTDEYLLKPLPLHGHYVALPQLVHEVSHQNLYCYDLQIEYI